LKGVTYAFCILVKILISFWPKVLQKYIVIFFLAAGFAISKPDSLALKIGPTGGVSNVMNKTSLPLIPGTDKCGSYSSGTETSFNLGLYFGINILNGYLEPYGKVYYENRPVFLQEFASPYEVLDPNSGEYVPLVREFNYRGELNYISIEVGTKIFPFPDIPFYLGVGADAGNPLAGTDYTNTERIASPSGVLFPGEVLSREISAGEIKNASSSYGALGSFGYHWEIKPGMHINPEISYRQGLNSIVKNENWDMNIIRGGITISWNLNEPPPPPPKKRRQIEKPDTIVNEPAVVAIDTIPELPADTAITEKKDLIAGFSGEILPLTETTITRSFPLLPYIFFDSASAEIRSVYHVEKFSPENPLKEIELSNNTLDIYYNLLEIIGQRLYQNPGTKITITGTSDGLEVPDSMIAGLAENRGNAVKKYLVENWEISPDRITLRTSNIPELPTKDVYAEGPQENRRVEISTNDYELMRPVIKKSFLEYHSDKKSLNFETKIDGDLRGWSLNIFGGEKLLFSQSDNSNPGDFIEINLNNRVYDKFGNNSNSLNVVLQVTDLYGNTSEKSIPLKVDIDRTDYELGRLNLIVFDFDKSEITSTNKNMIENFVTSSIKNNSTVEIIGSTDRLGDKNYNKKLSMERAINTASYILSLVPDAGIANVEGIGDERPVFDNDLPEGRFYSRTVLIEVKTPLE
jgi:outer membrane protein OmpA-like peptidoglycan-associated protein